jgi:hypothetical protein
MEMNILHVDGGFGPFRLRDQTAPLNKLCVATLSCVKSAIASQLDSGTPDLARHICQSSSQDELPLG